MKNIIAKPLLLVILIVSPLIIQAQKALVQYFPAGIDDANILVDGYLSKMGEAMASGLNSGWYTNGAPHSKLGIEFNVTFNTVFVPSEDEFFATPVSFANAKLIGVQNVDIINKTTSPLGTGQIPALYGSKFNFPIFGFQTGHPNEFDANNPLLPVQFKGPNGNSLKDIFLINAVVVPTMQLGIGVIANTDLKLRYTPQVKFGNIKFGSWGFGLMHSIKDHIPGLKMVPFGWSILAAYSQLNGEVDLSGQWFSSAAAESAGDFNLDTGQAAQVGEFKSTAFTIQTIVSKKFSVVTVYGGVGYGFGNTEFDIKGDYYIRQVNQNPISGLPPVFTTLSVPVSIKETDANYFNTFEYDAKSLRFTTGLRLKMGPITFHGDYTFQRVNVLSFGLGFSVKE